MKYTRFCATCKVVSSLPWWLHSKKKFFACNSRAAGDMCLIPEWGRSPGGGHGNPLQYSCLENPLDRGAPRATVRRVARKIKSAGLIRDVKNLLTAWIHDPIQQIRMPLNQETILAKTFSFLIA